MDELQIKRSTNEKTPNDEKRPLVVNHFDERETIGEALHRKGSKRFFG